MSLVKPKRLNQKTEWLQLAYLGEEQEIKTSYGGMAEIDCSTGEFSILESGVE